MSLDPTIPTEFIKYYRDKLYRGRAGRAPRMLMSLEECWAKWQQYWQDRQNGPGTKIPAECYVLGRYGDAGDYTVENCRVITHRENTLERDHSKLRDQNRYSKPWVIGGIKQPRSVKVGDTVYATAMGAARDYGIHKTTVRSRCLSKNYPEWRYDEAWK